MNVNEVQQEFLRLVTEELDRNPHVVIEFGTRVGLAIQFLPISDDIDTESYRNALLTLVTSRYDLLSRVLTEKHSHALRLALDDLDEWLNMRGVSVNYTYDNLWQKFRVHVFLRTGFLL